jgi:hypothetical protein
MKIKVENKVTVLSDTLKEFFGNKMNLARIKFFGLFIIALCKVQTVCFEKLAFSFDSNAKADSSLRRIQRFISEYSLDSDLVSRFIFSLLPHEPPYRMVLDRTNWKFGTKNIKILTLGIIYKRIAFPILFQIMPKFGNSSIQ